jgi:hypothetical protein
MRAFNAFQIVALFAAWPHIIGWLGTKPFPYSTAAFWIAIVAYIVGFAGMVFMTFDGIKDN